MSEELKPLDMMRVVRSDRSLKGPAKSLMVFAVLRVNNATRKVSCSLEMLADDAGVSYKTAKRVFAADQAEVLKYFARVKRSKRRVDLWFRLPAEVGLDRESPSATDRESPSEVENPREGQRVPLRGTQSPPFCLALPLLLQVGTQSSADPPSYQTRMRRAACPGRRRRPAPRTTHGLRSKPKS